MEEQNRISAKMIRGRATDIKRINGWGRCDNSNMKMDKQVAEMIEGYARANAFLEDERMERLARLTLEEARAAFDELTEGWEGLPDKGEGLERLDLWRAETLVAVRRAFEQMARAKGLL